MSLMLSMLLCENNGPSREQPGGGVLRRGRNNMAKERIEMASKGAQIISGSALQHPTLQRPFTIIVFSLAVSAGLLPLQSDHVSGAVSEGLFPSPGRDIRMVPSRPHSPISVSFPDRD
jgi:hypothetical protein